MGLCNQLTRSWKAFASCVWLFGSCLSGAAEYKSQKTLKGKKHKYLKA